MRRMALVGLAVVLGICGAVRGQAVGAAYYENLGDLPYLYGNISSHYLSSYDRTGGNDDGFRGTYSQLYVQDNGEHVIFEEKGPGCVYNLWFTGSGIDLHWGKIRLYFDGEKTPRFECEARDLFSGSRKPFVYPLVGHSLRQVHPGLHGTRPRQRYPRELLFAGVLLL